MSSDTDPERAPGTSQNPKRWLPLVSVCIGFSIFYLLDVPGIGSGRDGIATDEWNVAEARARDMARKRRAPVVDEALLRSVANDPARLAHGRATFANACAPCHRADGGGNIGPNLTDRYWIHGAKPMDLYTTVTGGVPHKGMPAWVEVLEREQQVDVVGYALTLRGTHVENPKPPQGTEAEGEGGSQPMAVRTKS